MEEPSMAASIVPEGTRPCLWMNAGLVAWKLCDRDYDCEHCPFDAALHGGAAAGAGAGPEAVAGATLLVFPDDRSYTEGHTWLRPQNGGWRLGLDVLAAALVGFPQAVRLPAAGRALAAGDTMAVLEMAEGRVAVASPVAGRVARPNPAVLSNPQRLAQEPYDEGWLLEVRDARGRPLRAADSRDATDHRHQTVHDLRRFRRRLAFHLLTGAAALGPTLPDGGVPLTDLRLMLGADHWLDLVRDLVH
jgi:glycine cleavage system H protein